jgi:DNA-binding transcriptional MocR family regulator
LYRLLAAALQQAILRGDIAAGSRLPAARRLAQQLAASRTTVVAAYDLLRQDGWVERRIGSGTWVCLLAGDHAVLRRNQLAGGLASGPFYDPLLEPQSALIDLTRAHVAAGPALPRAAYSLAAPQLSGLLQDSGDGYAPLGWPALREAIANRYTRAGLPTAPDQILITSGAQQAIYLVATLYAHRGDHVLIENPTYAGASDAFRAGGARLIPIPVAEEGLRVDLLAGLVKAHLPQIIYVTPTCHNPTGSVLPEEGRRVIARVAGEYGVPVLEDSTLADLVFDGRPPPAIASYAEKAPIITVDSLSKLFWAGLRVGWVRAPVSVVARLARLKAVVDLGSSLLAQAIAVGLIEQLDEVRAARHSVEGSHTSYLRLPFALDGAILEEGIQRLAGAWAAFTRLSGKDRSMMNVVV